MDLRATYSEDPSGVEFAFASGGRERMGVVSLQALAALAGSAISTKDEALLIYHRHRRYIHATAIRLHAAGQARPIVRSADVR